MSVGKHLRVMIGAHRPPVRTEHITGMRLVRRKLAMPHHAPVSRSRLRGATTARSVGLPRLAWGCGWSVGSGGEADYFACIGFGEGVLAGDRGSNPSRRSRTFADRRRNGCPDWTDGRVAARLLGPDRGRLSDLSASAEPAHASATLAPQLDPTPKGSAGPGAASTASIAPDSCPG